MTLIAILGDEADARDHQGTDKPPEDDDGLLLRRALERRGMTARRVSWRSLGTNWDQYDAAIVATLGGCVEDSESFLAVLAGIEANGCGLINSLQTILWNANPNSCADLTASGVEIVPSQSVMALASDVCARLTDDSESHGLLVRQNSIVGIEGCSFLPNRAEQPDPVESADDLTGLWLQSAPRALFEEGLWTFVFVQDELVHTALRLVRPDPGTRLAFSPATHPTEPDLADLECAARVVASVPVRSAYTRVDMVRQFDGQLSLLDLDLIAPQMFLAETEDGADRLAAAVETFLQARPGDWNDPVRSPAPERDTAPA